MNLSDNKLNENKSFTFTDWMNILYSMRKGLSYETIIKHVNEKNNNKTSKKENKNT